MAAATARPDREAFLRRLEEQQRQNSGNTKDNETTAVDNTSSTLSPPSNETLPPSATMVDDDALLSYLASCGIKDTSLDVIDPSSLDLLRQLAPALNKDVGGVSNEAVVQETISSETKEPIKKPLLKKEVMEENISQHDGSSTNAEKTKSETGNPSKRPLGSDTNAGLSTPSPIPTPAHDTKSTSPMPIPNKIPATTPPQKSNPLDLKTAIPLAKDETESDLLSRQIRMMEIIERQQTTLTALQNHVQSLEQALHDQQRHAASLERALRSKHPDVTIAPLPPISPARAAPLPPTTPPAPPAPPQFPILSLLSSLTFSLLSHVSSLASSLRGAISRTKLYRIAAAAYREAIRQNIHANLDRWLLIKLLFFVAVFGSRNKEKRDATSFVGRYRVYVFGVTAVFLYLLQTGILSFLWRFVMRDLRKIWRDEDIGEGRVEEGGGEGGGVVVEAGGRRGFTDGGIERGAAGGGFFKDLKYILGSFILSLIPTWRPVVADDGGEGARVDETAAPGQQQRQLGHQQDNVEPDDGTGEGGRRDDDEGAQTMEDNQNESSNPSNDNNDNDDNMAANE